MLSTVFFDSSEQGAGEAVRGITHEERPRYPEAVPGSPYQNAPSYVYPSFGCQGTVQVTELKASVSWWLDCAPDNNNNNTSGRLQNPRIVLLANNNNASASASKSCRNDLFTFEVPLQSSRHGTALLGCGVSRQAQGGNQLAITFVTNTLHVGYKMVSLHRDSPSGPLYFHTTIEGGMHHYFNSKARREFYRDSRTVVTVDPLLEDNRCASILDRDLTVRSHDSIEDRQTSGEQTIEDDEMRRGESRGVMWCAGALSRVAHAFSRTGKPTTAVHHDSSSRALSTIQETQPTTTFTYRQVTAVVVAEVPESQFTQNPNIIAFLVLTDGRTIWRVTLSGDGTVTETQFEDRFLKEMEQIDKHFSTKKFNNFSLLQPLFRYGTALLNPVYYEDARLRNAVQVDNLQTSTLPREAAWQERKEEIFQMLIAQQRDGGQAAGGAGGGLWGKLKSFTGASAATLKNTASLRLDFHKSMVGGKYYLGLSAVQESSLFLVCRANGFVEVFNVVDMSSSDVYPMCALPAELQESLVEQYLRENMPNPNANIAQLPPLPLFGQQWSVRLSRTNGIHFFVSLGLQNERRSVLGVIPQVEHCETQRVVLRNCFGVRPPTLTSTPMGCTFNVKVKAEEDASRPRGSTRVLLHEAQVQAAVLWDRGVEEEALVVEGHTIGSLFATTRESLSFVQVVEAKMTSPEMELNVLSTSCYAAQGLRSPLAALFSTENTFFVVDWSLNIIRAHAIRTHFPNLEDHRIGLMIETANIDNDDDVPMEFQNLRLVTAKYGLHWIPCVEESVEATAAGADPELAEDNEALQRCFREGISALESAGQGASFFVDLLQEILQGGSVVSGVSRVVSEDILSGFIPSKCVSNEDMCRAIRRVLKPLGEDDDDSGEQGFYSHSRVYLLHSVSTMLLQRVACVLVSYIGWFVSSGLSSPAPHPITDATVAVMEVLTATYHATLVAGPDLCRLATVSEMQRITSDTIAFAVVNAFLPPAAVIAPLVVGSASSSEVPSLESFLLQTAYLLRSGVGFSESCSAACTVYCNALCNRVPLLQHFLLLHQLDHLHSVRSTTSVVKLSIRSIPLALTQLIHLDQVNFLFYFGGLPLRGSGVVWCAPERQDAFHRQLKTFVSNASGTIPAVYLVGILRRVIVLDDNSSVTCRVNESLLSPLYMALKTVLRDCEKVPEGGVIEGEPGARRYGVLRDTLIELQVETLLCLARSHVESASIGQCCQCLEDCLALLPQCKGASVYSNCVDVIAASIVEAACLTISSPVDVMQKLVNVSTVNKELDDRIVSRWNHFIVRIPTSSANDATEARRRHAILGLYRFLMKRRSFAQCGRIFSDLASLLRSSTQRKMSPHYISVGELADMALEAVEMIHTEAPLEGGEPHGELTTTTTSETDAVAWCSSDRQRCTRRDLPWLRRRAYQAHCERHLLRLQCSVECTDLWLDHLPEQDYLNSLRRLVDALMENRLWREAFNLTLLAGKDTVGVLCLWAVDLLRNGVSQYKDGLTSPAFHTYHEWTLVVDYCRELCQLRPKYNAVASIPFRRVLITAYLCDYTRTPRKLIEAFANVDLYGCTVTCLDICTNLRGRSDRSALLDVEDSESIAHEGGQTEDVVVYHDVEVPAHTWDTEILPWLVLLEAVRYGYMLLTGNDTRGNSVLPIQTALFDTIAAYTKEFLENQSARALVMRMVPDACDVARRFLTAM